MHRRLRLTVATAITVLYGVLFFILNYCCHVSTTYCAVTDSATSWGSVADTFTTEEVLALSVPDHVVRDGKLYLKVQVTRPSMLLVTFVGFGDWDAERIRVFRQQHPELEMYWPDKERPDGGVKWLRSRTPGR
jgi:hypothetical protein